MGHVKVDSALSSSSENPVQNKVLNSALGNKLATTGDASNTTVAFTEATAMAELATGEKMSTLFGKLKLTVKNVISILNLLGNTDISSISDGTVTGILSFLKSSLDTTNSNLNAKLDKSGSEQLKVNRNTGTFREAYNNAAVVITGNVPAIGFHNPGIEGAALYLLNGQLVLLFNNGDAYTLDMTYFTHADV